jgi:lysozyme family protein
VSSTLGPNPLFDAIFNEVILGIEGGAKFSDHPSDPGGPTRFGVTEKVARKHGYTGPVHLLPMPVAKDIYLSEFWNPLRLADVGVIAGMRVAKELFEQNINLKYQAAGVHLQRALNAFNQRGKLYDDVTEDGDIGPKTIDALRRFMAFRKAGGATVLLRALNAQQGVYYLDRVSETPAKEDFIYGWFDHRVG